MQMGAASDCRVAPVAIADVGVGSDAGLGDIQHG